MCYDINGDKVKDNNIFNKNTLVTIQLAKMFIATPIGQRILTFSELVDVYGVARGTVQNAMEALIESGAITLESKGHLGTYLLKKNIDLLLEKALLKGLIGVMPLPYSKRYEGLATGIISEMEHEHNIQVNMAYMRGAKKRIEMVLNGRYDFAIISRYAAYEALKDFKHLKIVKDFGARSYLDSHVLLFCDKSKSEVMDGMRVGIDIDSIDQENLTNIVCEGKDVTYLRLGYNQIIDKLLGNKIDVAVWNKDELRIQQESIHAVPLELINNFDDTVAVIVIDSNRLELEFLIGERINVSHVLEVQQLVIEDKIVPSY